jgi:hypothetical protein
VGIDPLAGNVYRKVTVFIEVAIPDVTFPAAESRPGIDKTTL